MSFFFNEEKEKPAAAKRGPAKARSGVHIPIQSMQQLGCRACPSNKDGDLRNPKMEPEGKKSPRVYVLLSAPSSSEDRSGRWLDDKAGDALLDALEAAGVRERDIRVQATVRCFQGSSTNWQRPEVGPTECCRVQVSQDIEDAAPLIVIGVGDAALHWATGFNANAIPFRGQMIATKIGKHRCWYMPVLYPNFVYKQNQRHRSEWELAFRHDIAKAVADLDSLKPPSIFEAPYDGGIELITGAEAGDMGRLEDALHRLLRNPENGLDIETNGLRPHYIKEPHIWTAAVGTFSDTVAFSVDHPEGWGTDRRMHQVRGMLGDFILHSRRKICHNTAFEMEWTNYFYGDLALRLSDWEDTMAVANTLDERRAAPKKGEYDASSAGAGLGAQCRIYFGFDLKKQSNVDAARFLEYPIRDGLRYNGMDTKWTHKLFQVGKPMLAARRADADEYEHKIRSAPTLVLTTAKGIPVDQEYARKMNDDLGVKVKDIERRIQRDQDVIAYTKRRGTFDPGNDDQVLALMEMLGRPEIRSEDRDGKVRRSTDAEALGAMPAKEVPVAPMILERRGLEKLRGTYLGPVAEGRYVCADGMMRPMFGQMVTRTGRLNSEDPNAQNYPKHKHKEVRGMIYAPDDHWIAALDYGQIEARVFAMASEDEVLMRALWTAYDIHGFWADYYLKRAPNWADYISAEFSIDRGDAKAIRKEGRQICKNNWVFPQFFGASIKSCAENMHLDIDIVEGGGGLFWDEFKGVKRWQEKLIKSYEKNLYVETLTGLRRRGPMTKNELLNMPIQGTAARIVKEAMNALSEESFLNGDPELQPSLNVHDDLTSVLADKGLEAKIEQIARIMCKPRFSFINVPLIVEASVGARWHKLEELDARTISSAAKDKAFRSNDFYDIPNPYERKAA